VRAHALLVVQRDYEVICPCTGGQGLGVAPEARANTGHFTARSRDVPTVVAKASTARLRRPSYMAFEEKLAGFELKFVAPKNAFVTRSPWRFSRAPQSEGARAFIEFLLSQRGQKVFMERGLFPITPK